MKKGKSPVAISLLRNSKAAMFSAIEIHNKPIFTYRYEVTTMLIINAWELLLKAYIYKFLKNVKLFQKDGKTKPFDECLGCVASNIGKDFQAIKESLDNLYKYRNKITHFYCEDLDALLFSLIRANVGFYVEFIEKHFAVDLSKETSLILLPIGFLKLFSPIDFLSNTSKLTNASKEVKEFIKGIIESSKRLESANIKDSILVEYRMSLMNEKRVNNADIVGAINNEQPQSTNITIQNSLKNIRFTNDPNTNFTYNEESLFKEKFNQKYDDVVDEARKRFIDFQKGKKFNEIMKNIKGNSNLYKRKHLDNDNPKSGGKDWYSKEIYDELAKHYQPKKELTS